MWHEAFRDLLSILSCDFKLIDLSINTDVKTRLLRSSLIKNPQKIQFYSVNQQSTRNTDVKSQKEEVNLKLDGKKEEKIMIMEDRNKNRNSNNHKCRHRSRMKIRKSRKKEKLYCEKCFLLAVHFSWNLCLWLLSGLNK